MSTTSWLSGQSVSSAFPPASSMRSLRPAPAGDLDHIGEVDDRRGQLRVVPAQGDREGPASAGDIEQRPAPVKIYRRGEPDRRA
jgi:hypothetical protein